MAKKSESSDSAKAKSGNKAAALRESIKVNGWNVELATHETYMRDTFGVNMDRQQVSQYLSAERRRQGMPRKRRKRKGAAAATAATPAATTATGVRSDVMLQFISTVRQWEEKLGSKKVLDVIAALYDKKK